MTTENNEPSPPPPTPPPPPARNRDRSEIGGLNFEPERQGQNVSVKVDSIGDVSIGGDVVGRDKAVNQTYIETGISRARVAMIITSAIIAVIGISLLIMFLVAR